MVTKTKARCVLIVHNSTGTRIQADKTMVQFGTNTAPGATVVVALNSYINAVCIIVSLILSGIWLAVCFPAL